MKYNEVNVEASVGLQESALHPSKGWSSHERTDRPDRKHLAPKNLMVAVAMAGIGVSSVAQAQSSVTLYGQLDSGIEYLTNANKTTKSVVQAIGANVYANEFGFRGVEDLGGGLRAIFTLEGQWNPYTGTSLQGGRLFGRQAWVGLQDDQNKIIVGRVYTPLYDVLGYLDPALGASQGLLAQDGGVTSRVDNGIRYTRTQGPFHVNAVYSFGQDGVDAPIGQPAGASGNSKEISISGDYTTKQAMVAVIYDRIHGPLTASQDGFDLFVPSLIPVKTTGADRAERIAVAGQYTFGNTSLYSGYRHLTSTVGSVAHYSNLFWGGVIQHFGPAAQLMAGVYHQTVAGIDARPTSAILQGRYLLSKTTGFYVNTSYVWNTQQSNMSVDAQSSTVIGKNQFGANVGIFHFF